jgi:hypothetical protein
MFERIDLMLNTDARILKAHKIPTVITETLSMYEYVCNNQYGTMGVFTITSTSILSK